MALPTISNGTLADADEVMDNMNFGYTVPNQTYTGTAFDTALAAGPSTAAHVLSVGGGVINDGVFIEVTCAAAASSSGTGASASALLRYSTAESGGSFTQRFNSTLVSSSSGGSGNSDKSNQVATVRFYYEATSDEKTNGLDIQIFSQCALSGSGSSSLTNVQTNIITL